MQQIQLNADMKKSTHSERKEIHVHVCADMRAKFRAVIVVAVVYHVWLCCSYTEYEYYNKPLFTMLLLIRANRVE